MCKLDAVVQMSVIPTRRQEADTEDSLEACRPGGMVYTLAKRLCLQRGRKVRGDTQRLSSDLQVLAGFANDTVVFCRGGGGGGTGGRGVVPEPLSALLNSFAPSWPIERYTSLQSPGPELWMAGDPETGGSWPCPPSHLYTHRQAHTLTSGRKERQ